jgi:formate hydrogenlyase subunit 3/multisubunit Na+/H+ antiporter MnhD subunit
MITKLWRAFLYVLSALGLAVGFAFLLALGVYGYVMFFQDRVHDTWEWWKWLFHAINSNPFWPALIVISIVASIAWGFFSDRKRRAAEQELVKRMLEKPQPKIED